MAGVDQDNSLESVAEAKLAHAGIRDRFDAVVSADTVRALKPASAPYELVAARYDVPVSQVRLVAAHSWDISGALAAGCSAAFVARPGMVLSPVGPDLADVVDHPVFAPFSWLVSHLVLPNFTFFAWTTLLVEAALGVFLLLGLATRFWALIGIAQSLAITMSVLNAPNAWEWSYYLMILAHVGLFPTAAGRSFGLDGLLRPTWRASESRMARLLLRAS